MTSPPLSIRKAIGVAAKVLRKYVDDPRGWHVDTVALRRIGTQSGWYYLVAWRPSSQEYVGDGIEIAVLMNGETIEPQVSLGMPDRQ